MRFVSVILSLILPVLALARSSPSQQPIQVYLHPSPSSPSHVQSAPTLTPEQAKAVLSHHLGESIGDFEEIPQDESLWQHLMGMWGGGDEVGKVAQRPKVVVIEGGVSPQDVLPSSLHDPAFYLPENPSTRTLLRPYLQSASHLLTHILDYIPSLTKPFKDTFELAGTSESASELHASLDYAHIHVEAASALSHELSCLIALSDSLPWIDDLKHSKTWEAISIKGLSHVDRNDEVWEAGRQGVKAGLEAMTTPDSPPLLLIIMPSASTHQYKARALPNPLRRAENNTLAEACYSSNETCTESTSCNGRGACGLKSKSGDNECWGCKCSNGFAGVECQKDDYSIPFVIIVFSSLLLMFMLVGSVALLFSVGDTKLPSTLTLAVGGHMKRD